MNMPLAIDDIEIPAEDLPFMAPPDRVIALDLPFPPSINATWRMVKGRAILSREAREWRVSADAAFLLQKRNLKKIEGKFEVTLTFEQSRRRTGDLDNRIKAVLDALQRFDLIDNDRHCERLIAQWGDADMGCRVTVRELASTFKPIGEVARGIVDGLRTKNATTEIEQ